MGIAAFIILALAGLHASLVFLYNMPENALKTAFEPVIRAYKGPQLTQSWELFAPQPGTKNVDVLVRGHDGHGRMSPWYDATVFFQDAMDSNRFTTLRPVSEGLFHSLLATRAWRKKHPFAIESIVLDRTAASVLKTYDRSPLQSMQIEIDERPISIQDGTTQSGPLRLERFDWKRMPRVEALVP